MKWRLARMNLYREDLFILRFQCVDSMPSKFVEVSRVKLSTNIGIF